MSRNRGSIRRYTIKVRSRQAEISKKFCDEVQQVLVRFCRDIVDFNVTSTRCVYSVCCSSTMANRLDEAFREVDNAHFPDKKCLGSIPPCSDVN
jgi:hypothetical protein